MYFTYGPKQPHLSEAGGGIMRAVVEFRHLLVLPSVIAFRKERSPLWVECTDRL